jgi:starch-binding outer membrane protein, SusD/RagB family
MKSKILKLSTLVVIMSFSNSCSDRLEITDPNRLSSGQYYSNPAQAVAAIDAIYNALIIDGMYQRITPVYNDSRGDEVSSRSPWGFLTGLGAFTVPPTEGALEIFWAGHYIMVSRANQAIEKVPTVPELDASLRDRLIGQAHFLRALAYFNLTNNQDNVPLITVTPNGSESFYPSNASVTQDQIYDLVQADLEKAISVLPVDYADVTGLDKGQNGRATKGAAQALLGKLFLYRKNYAKASENFNAVINSNKYDLAANYADLWVQDPAVERANPSKIFWAEFTTSANSDFNWGGDPNVNWRQFLALTPTYSVGDFFDFYPTKFLYDEMRKEKTKDGKLDPRYHSTILSYEPTEGYTTAYGKSWAEKGFKETDYYIKKYTNAVDGADAFTSGYNYHIIRFEDVLLMQAECLANTGSLPAAATLVQRVRNRANLPDRQAEFAGYSQEKFMEQIEHERIMEFAIEGSRWHDLKRWGHLKNPTKLAELKSHDFEFNTFTEVREYIPIPQSELDRNSNLVGNKAN